LWGSYGFYDAFNLNQNWFATSYLAIDQGPIVAMIENQRTGLLWQLFMKNPELAPALQALGFQSDSSPAAEAFITTHGFDVGLFPNPLSTNPGVLNLEFSLLQKQKLTAQILDGQGRRLQILFKDREMFAGVFQEQFQMHNLPKGVFFIEIKNETGGNWMQKLVAE
jgi:hypothetical protein